MKEADRQAIALLNQIHDAQAAGGDASFASLTGSPEDNAALDAALDAKQGDLGFTPVPDTRTVNGHALSGNVTVTKGDVGLGNADNTADTAKPVSTDQATAIAGKVSDTAYDATSWDGVTTIAPSKNAVRDKIEAVVASIPPAHSGGVIGTAVLAITTDTATMVSENGVLTGAEYTYSDSTGRLSATFLASQADAFFLPTLTVDGSVTLVHQLREVATSETGFQFVIKTLGDSTPNGGTQITTARVSVFRISQ